MAVASQIPPQRRNIMFMAGCKRKWALLFNVKSYSKLTFGYWDKFYTFCHLLQRVVYKLVHILLDSRPQLFGVTFCYLLPFSTAPLEVLEMSIPFNAPWGSNEVTVLMVCWLQISAYRNMCADLHPFKIMENCASQNVTLGTFISSILPEFVHWRKTSAFYL